MQPILPLHRQTFEKPQGETAPIAGVLTKPYHAVDELKRNARDTPPPPPCRPINLSDIASIHSLSTRVMGKNHHRRLPQARFLTGLTGRSLPPPSRPRLLLLAAAMDLVAAPFALKACLHHGESIALVTTQDSMKKGRLPAVRTGLDPEAPEV